MKITVIHHSADYDGIFCREIARRFMPEADLIGWDFGDAPLAVPDGLIFVMDLPVDRVFGLNFANNSECPSDRSAPFLRNVIWIDHHKSSIETHPPAIPGYRIDGVAACRLAYQWFRSQISNKGLPTKEQFVRREVDEPFAVRLAGEYDIWDKRDPQAETFQFGLRAYELTPAGSSGAGWGTLLDEGLQAQEFIALLLENGDLLQRFQKRQDASLVNHRSFLMEFEGLKLLALNTARCNSLTFSAKDVPETGHEALCGFYWTGKTWKVSLYHARHRTDLDLSAIAVRYGGGGHRGACGFETKTLPWL